MTTTARARYEELHRKVDAFFARVSARHPGEMACAAGCSDCCARRLSVTEVEALGIREGLSAMDPARRESLRQRARVASLALQGEGKCAALDEGGRCMIYDARPLVCRSHGVPLRFAEERASVAGGRRLPLLDACFHNFIGRDLSSIDPDCVLDQQTLSTMLAVIDAAHAAETGGLRGARLDLADLLAEG